VNDSAPAATEPGFVRRYWAIIVAIVAILAAMSVRATVEHMRAYERAVELENEGRIDAAIDEYRWSLRWHTPWGPWHDDAAQALLDIGTAAEKERPERAVAALDSLRSGLLAARSFYQPRADLVAQMNERIPPLLVRMAIHRGDTRDKAALLQRFKADYARPIGVPGWASLAVSLGFILWLLGLVMAFTRGVDDEGKLAARGWRWIGASIAGFGAWALAMWLA